VIVAAAVLVAAGAALVIAPPGARVLQLTSLAPAGPVGYVVCPTAVTPVELDTRTAEAPIPLPLTGAPVLGSFAVGTSPDGRFAYVATTDGVAAASTARTTAAAPTASTATRPDLGGVHNVLVPIDLATQQALAPIPLPGRGGSHAVVVLPGDRTVLVADGSSVVPVDPQTRTVGAPIDLGAGHTVFGMALDPGGSILYALVPDGVIPIDTAHEAAQPEITTGLAVSSLYSPHGIAVSAEGSTVYVVGQGGADYGGRVMPIQAATGTPLPAAGFDQYGIADPAALTVVGDEVLVVDAANNWVNPLPPGSFADPPTPERLPSRAGSTAITGTDHPTDIVTGPGGSGSFIVDGFDSVVPFEPQTGVFGHPVAVCSGATAMAVAPVP